MLWYVIQSIFSFICLCVGINFIYYHLGVDITVGILLVILAVANRITVYVDRKISKLRKYES